MVVASSLPCSPALSFPHALTCLPAPPCQLPRRPTPLCCRKPLNRRFIVVEGIYANTGDLAPLDALRGLMQVRPLAGGLLWGRGWGRPHQVLWGRQLHKELRSPSYMQPAARFPCPLLTCTALYHACTALDCRSTATA